MFGLAPGVGLSLLWIAAAQAGEHTVMVGVDAADQSAVLARLRVLALSQGAPPQAKAPQCWARAGFCVVDLPDPGALDTLAGWAGVTWVERDQRIPGTDRQAGPASDAYGTSACPDLWGLDDIGMDEAWTLAGDHGAGSPVVAVQDSGFLLTHEDLVGQVSGQYDYGDGDTIPEVEWDIGVPGHGTFISGIIAARGDNLVGRAGVLPEGRLNLQKIADHNGALYYSYAASAMADVAEGDLGVGVVSYSIASSSTTTAFTSAVDALGDADILLVAAAGNCGSASCWDADNDSYPLYPAGFSSGHVVSVAGTLESGALNSWSHYGASTVDIAAPGVNLCSLGVSSNTDTYSSSGTSYATPLVAGVAALLRGRFSGLTAVETARVLRASALKDGQLEGIVQADGRLSASRALKTAVPRLPAVSDATIDGEGRVSLTLENVGAAGQATVLLQHDESVVVVDAGGWTVTPWAPGDALVLPDAGDHTATGHGTLLTAPLAAESDLALDIVVRTMALGATEASVRLVMASDGAAYLNAPYQSGEPDETGFLAWTIEIDAVGIWVDEGGGDSGEVDSAEPEPDPDPDPEPHDSAVPDDVVDDGSDPVDGGGDGGKDGGCSTGALPITAMSWIGVLGLVSRRRRR